jgi:dephospho-CoA kinase
LWVVTAPYAAQLERLMRARGLSEAQARMRIEAQPPQAEKIALADVVIDNGGSLERTRAQVVKQFSNLPSRISNLP